jgi:hypothetical protein
MPSKAFLAARKRGEVAQDYVRGMFQAWGLKVSQTPRGYNPGWDMTVEGTLHGQQIRTTVEVKYDELSEETKNIYLDTNSLKKSKASILTICVGKPIHTIYMLPLQEALLYAQKCPYKVRGGEFGEQSACPPKSAFLEALRPQVLTAPCEKEVTRAA